MRGHRAAKRGLLLVPSLCSISCGLARGDCYDDDLVSMLQIRVEGDLTPIRAQQEQNKTYSALGRVLGQDSGMSHSFHILKYLVSSGRAPELGREGCLFLPSNDAWKAFYEYVEHPYPPLFAELFDNAYDASCNATGQRRMRSACPEGHVRGNQWSLLEQGGGGPSGCVGVRHKGNASGIRVFETDGHVGLPRKWQGHIQTITGGGMHPPSNMRRKTMREKEKLDMCEQKDKLPKVPADKKLVIPTRFIICCVDVASCPVDRAMIEDQVSWMNTGYSGQSPVRLESFDRAVEPPHVDTQLQFELVNLTLVGDAACARQMFTDNPLAFKYNQDGLGMLTYIVATDDQSGILGMAEFPTSVPESSDVLSVLINMNALRGISKKVQQVDMSYDEGDTCIHEGGHSLGLYHTFEGGCMDDDKVGDTNPEQFPSFSCADARSCDGSPDPVHNFMDYAPDSCMVGFTEQQKRRLWCSIEHHRPEMYQRALRPI
mmetsp:Transcript_8414/g.23629  ORF Transcript_8414/g.23629 Transcript_8414/m.23629 type:complete len:487 (-) Transcript_8414:145-1605(-)